MKKYAQFGIVLLLLVWGAGILIFLNSTESRLTTAARVLLADPDGSGKTSVTNPYQDVRVTFSGREAILRGVVTSQADKEAVVKLIGEEVRVKSWLNSHLNPVASVRSNELKVSSDEGPRPKPWFILSLYGGHQRLDGLAGDPDQRFELVEALAAKLPAPAIPLNSQVMIDPKASSLENWAATLEALPDLSGHPQDRSLILVGSGDGTWTELPPEATDEAVAAALKNSAPQVAQISSALRKLRDWKYPTPEELEEQRQAKLADIEAAAAKFAQEREANPPVDQPSAEAQDAETPAAETPDPEPADPEPADAPEEPVPAAEPAADDGESDPAAPAN